MGIIKKDKPIKESPKTTLVDCIVEMVLLKKEIEVLLDKPQDNS
jgi:hypothetical protein